MSLNEKEKDSANVSASPVASFKEIQNADDVLLAELGYASEFRREFSVTSLSLVHSLKKANPQLSVAH